MNIDLNYVVISLVVVWVVIFYVHWRYLRSLYPNSRFRAYDILFMTIVLFLIFSRIVAVLADAGTYFQGDSPGRVFNLLDLNLKYLVMLYIPLIAYQFASFHIEINVKWKEQAARFIATGALLVLSIEVFEIVRGVFLAWPNSNFYYHLSQAVWLLLVLVILFLRSQNRLPFLTMQAVIALIPLGIIVANLAFPVLESDELVATIVSQIVLALIMLIPFLSGGERRSKQSRQITPLDTR